VTISRTEVPQGTAPDGSGMTEGGSGVSSDDIIAKEKEIQEAQDAKAQLESIAQKQQEIENRKKEAAGLIESTQLAQLQTQASEASAAATPEAVPPTPQEAAPVPPPTRPKYTPPPPPVEEPFSIVNWIFDNLVLVGGIFLVVVVLIALIIFRRKRNEEESDSMFTTESTSMTTSSTNLSMRSATLAPSVAPQRGRDNSGVQSSNSILSEFSREGLGNVETGEVDPLAEADVYLAYGRAQQAEEILQDAMKKEPQRQDIYIKLLEVLADQKKVNDFESVANRLYNLCKGQGDHWQRAKVLGQRLMPGNPRFSDNPPAQASAPVIGGHMMDPQGFEPMEGPSVAQSIARAASRNVEQQHRGEQTEAPSLLTEMGESQFLLGPEESENGTNSGLGVDLDLEELSRFRNFGQTEEQVTFAETPPPSEIPSRFSQRATPSAEEMKDMDLNFKVKSGGTEGFATMTGETEGPWNDVATKLDLARAYQATGDVEACREILQEVLKEGDADQKAEAQAILQSLGA
jgi:pilus assembly protein FimV